MPRQIDRRGNKYGLWVVLKFKRRERAKNYWLCQCACGVKKVVCFNSLVEGKSKSCGCAKGAFITQANNRHGFSNARVYRIWQGMWQRCTNRKAPGWENYGGRGISVCRRWQSFENFLADMGLPSVSSTIERRDNERGYTPKNCIWIPRGQQNWNKRNTVALVWRGRTQHLSAWARELNIKRDTLRQRLRWGWTVEEAFTTPVAPQPWAVR